MNEANNTTVTELEKEALRAQLNQEKEEELVEVESTWKATLHQVEEKAQKEKDDIQVLLGEGETWKPRGRPPYTRWKRRLRRRRMTYKSCWGKEKLGNHVEGHPTPGGREGSEGEG